MGAWAPTATRDRLLSPLALTRLCNGSGVDWRLPVSSPLLIPLAWMTCDTHVTPIGASPAHHKRLERPPNDYRKGYCIGLLAHAARGPTRGPRIAPLPARPPHGARSRPAACKHSGPGRRIPAVKTCHRAPAAPALTTPGHPHYTTRQAPQPRAPAACSAAAAEACAAVLLGAILQEG